MHSDHHNHTTQQGREKGREEEGRREEKRERIHLIDDREVWRRVVWKFQDRVRNAVRLIT